MDSYQERIKKQYKLLSRKYCGVSDHEKKNCTNKIVRSHTIPKASLLKICDSNNQLLVTNKHPISIKNNKGKLSLKKLGINRTSTFNGFCSYHDNKLFAPIESKVLILDKKNIFLHIYRNTVHDLYFKRAQQNIYDKLLSKLITIDNKHVLNAYKKGIEYGLSSLLYHKEQLDQMLRSNRYDDIHAIIIFLEKPPDIMCSGSHIPYFDLFGKEIFKYMNETNAPIVHYSSLHLGSISYFLLSCIKKDTYYFNKYFTPLIDRFSYRQISMFIPIFLFSTSDNLAINPLWWNNLDNDKRKFLVDSIHPDFDYIYQEKYPLGQNLSDYNFSEVKKIEVIV